MDRKSATQKQKQKQNAQKLAANRKRQSSYYYRQRAAGKKQWKMWATPAQEKILRAVSILVASEEGIKIAGEVLLETVARLRDGF